LKLSELQSEEKLLAFLEQHALSAEEDIYVYQTIRNNSPWYVVISGEFDSFSEAKIALRTLSGSLSNLPVRVLIYEDIHQDIQLNND